MCIFQTGHSRIELTQVILAGKFFRGHPGRIKFNWLFYHLASKSDLVDLTGTYKTLNFDKFYRHRKIGLKQMVDEERFYKLS